VRQQIDQQSLNPNNILCYLLPLLLEPYLLVLSLFSKQYVGEQEVQADFAVRDEKI
jgi:hypothetical protein